MKTIYDYLKIIIKTNAWKSRTINQKINAKGYISGQLTQFNWKEL